MKILIAPDKFKGCLSAAAVAEAMAAGLRGVDPTLEIDCCPLADGGEGTVEALVAAARGKIVTRPVTGPLPGMRVDAQIGLLGDGTTAVIEMASASGLRLLADDQRNPMRTTSYGTGQLLRGAIALGARRIILGVGGSATTDGGVGCAQGFGAAVHLANGSVYGPEDRKLVGADVGNVLQIDMPEIAAEIIVACDVGNPLCGPDGAAAIFGPQKGATPQQVKTLDANLSRLAQRSNQPRLAEAPGAGAAGGLGFGLLAFFGASLRSGIEIVSEAVNLRERLAGVDLCLTGEGRLDGQSASGKTAVGVGRLCKVAGVPCIAVAGSIGPGAEMTLPEGIGAYFSICPRPMTLAEAMADAPSLLATTTEQVLRAWRLKSSAASRIIPA